MAKFNMVDPEIWISAGALPPFGDYSNGVVRIMKSRRISLIVVRSSTPNAGGTENTVFLPKCADVDDIVDFVYPTIESMMTRASGVCIESNFQDHGVLRPVTEPDAVRLHLTALVKSLLLVDTMWCDRTAPLTSKVRITKVVHDVVKPKILHRDPYTGQWK
jgi:hypothetical protein